MTERTKRWFYGCMLVAVAAAAVYVNSLPGEFVFDDHEAIENNPDVRTNTPLSDVFQNDFWGQRLSDPESHKSFRPLTILTFRLNRILHGMQPAGFHLFNLFCHSTVSSLLFVLCQKLRLSHSASLVCSLLFATHPIHSEAVANIVGRTELLSAVFFLLSLISYHHCLNFNFNQGQGADTKHSSNNYNYNRRQSEVTPPTRYSALCLVCSVFLAAVSMLCKEQGITVLAVCVAYDLFVASGKNLSQFSAALKEAVVVVLVTKENASKKSDLRWLKPFLTRVSLLFISAVALLSARLYLNKGDPPNFVESDNPASFSSHLSTRFLTYFHLVVLDLWLLLCPSRLCFDWSMDSIPLVQSATDVRNVWSIATALLFISFLFFVGFWSSSCLSTTSSSSVNGGNSSSEVTPEGSGNSEERHKLTVKHRRVLRTDNENYSSKHTWKNEKRLKLLSLFSLSLLVLPFLPASNLLFPVGFVIAERVLYLPSLGLCLLVAIGFERLQPRSWSGSGCGLRQLLLVTGASLLVLFYSVKTVDRNWDWANALSLAESAVPINPSNAKVFMTIGNHYAQNGNRRCELFYRHALQLRPNYTAAWTNLGLVLLNTDRPKEAESCYRRALSIKEDHINANTNMAHLCRLQGRWKEAVNHYSTALRRRPKNPLLHYYLGFVYEQMSSDEYRVKAEQEYGIAIEQHPSHWDSRLALARLLSGTTSSGTRLQRGYAKGKRLEKAIGHYQGAIQIKPDNAEAHFELGRLLLSKGLPLEARKALTIASQLNPKHASSHLELGYALEHLGKREEALVELRKALKLDPSLVVARQKIEELQAK